MKNRYVYKVVRKFSNNDGTPKYLSSNMENQLEITYKLNQFNTSPHGPIFVFKILKRAKEYINATYHQLPAGDYRIGMFNILQCIPKGKIEKLKFMVYKPEYGFSYGGDPSEAQQQVSKFWNRYKRSNKNKTNMDLLDACSPPENSYIVNSIKPIKSFSNHIGNMN